MSYLSKSEVRAHLRASGISDPATELEVADSFVYQISPAGKLTRGPYLRQFDEDEVLCQFIRKPSFNHLDPGAGSFFALKGAMMASLAITSGLSGRQLHCFVVRRPFTALEGVAAPVAIDFELKTPAAKKAWDWAGGGPGGRTQIFIPSGIVRSHLVGGGVAE